MIEQLTQLMVHAGATWVLWLLFILSFVSVAIALERLFAFRQSSSDVRVLVPKLRSLLRTDNEPGALKLLQSEDSVEGRVVAAGLAEADLGAASAEEAMAAAIGLERKRLEARLLILGTVGNNAPFIGLLGTVIGVVGAFDALGKPQVLNHTLGAANALAPERVMGTIAEALVATAVGLVVAIPAVAIFNYFQGRLTAAMADAQTLGHVLLAHLSAKGHAALDMPERTTSPDGALAGDGSRERQPASSRSKIQQSSTAPTTAPNDGADSLEIAAQ